MARLGTGITLALGAAAGAAAQYFLDAQAGRRRRHTARDRGLSLAKHQAADVIRKADQAAGHAKGAVHRHMPTPSDDEQYERLGDASLARKVETEIFRAADAPKGHVDVNVENGVVFLRGQVERAWIERLGSDAERVGGVKAVRNLLHPPGTPAPTTSTGAGIS